MAMFKILKRVLLDGERKAREVGDVVDIADQKQVNWLKKYNVIGDANTATVTTADAQGAEVSFEVKDMEKPKDKQEKGKGK